MPGGNYLANPERSETENKFDIRVDNTIRQQDNFFVRYSYGKDSNFLPSPFNNVLDGGSFQDGYSNNTAQGLAASEVHGFSNYLINEFRFGFNYLNSHRYNLDYNQNVAQQLAIPFPGVPYTPGQEIGGLPSLGFGDGTASIGASGYQPAIEKQHSFVFTDNVTWTHGRHAAKFGGELRFEQFTILEPAAARGTMDFGGGFPRQLTILPLPARAARPSPASCRAFLMVARSPASPQISIIGGRFTLAMLSTTSESLRGSLLTWAYVTNSSPRLRRATITRTPSISTLFR